MGMNQTLFSNPIDFLTSVQPEDPVLFFNPRVLRETAACFQSGFPGQVTYAVKANPTDMVLETLTSIGLEGFDVASPVEIQQVRALASQARLHFNNPVRTLREIQIGVEHQVCSYSVDSDAELTKLRNVLGQSDIEIAVRFKLPVGGAAYDFGSKFGAKPDAAAKLLARVARAGFTPALTFHPGTQCTDPQAWVCYIEAAAEIAQAAGVSIARLNVGGGFPSHRLSDVHPDLDRIFQAIGQANVRVFGTNAPALVCEPGRAMVAESLMLATRVKALRGSDTLFLNDGIYGGLAEWPSIGNSDRVQVITSCGQARGPNTRAFDVFGPTCDSLDKLPEKLHLPADIADDDFVLFSGMGAYSIPIATRFNGFGAHLTVAVTSF